MKFTLNGLYAYCITENEDGCMINNGQGFVMEYEQMIDVAEKLKKYAHKHKEELKQHNIETQIKFDEMMNNCKITPKSKTSAYVYVLKCGEYYKVGHSKNVRRRITELDNKPYKVDVVYISPPTPDAYKIEQGLHEWLEEDKVNGEWYDLPDYVVKEIIKYIEFGIKWEAQQDEIYD